MSSPRNLAEVRAVREPAARALAAKAYADARREAIREVLVIRDEAIRELLADHGPTEVARLCGVSLSHVKLVRRSGGS